MGKKSKRNRTAPATTNPRAAPAIRNSSIEDEETKDNLRFEDPYVEEYVIDEDEDAEEEEEEVVDDDMKPPSATATDHGAELLELVQAWNPLTGQTLEAGEELEMDPSAYKMHHAVSPEWPSLSFDFLRDNLGEARTRFPHSLQTVIGTQADAPDKNSLTVLQISDLAKMQVETEDDILGEEFNPDKDNEDDDSSSSDESDSEIDLDPVLEHYSIPHYGGVNRVRAMPQQQDIVATWSDVGQVNLFNIAAIRQRFERRKGETFAASTMADIPKKPFFTHKSKQQVEGFALAWSPVQAGHLATGDCSGRLHLWNPLSDGASSYSVSQLYESPSSSSSDVMNSIEDIQWSPTEATVLAGAQCGGNVLIFDTRAPNKAMLSHQIHAADVNVLSWNALVSNLLATGGDDGTLAVWDLRHFSKDKPEPLARFTPHKTPITSVEWHPTDESMLVASDDVGAYIYDLSVEEDDAAGGSFAQQQQDVPPQLLFVHCGSQQFKEVHWHPQISSCLMSTALTGFSIFIPSNL